MKNKLLCCLALLTVSCSMHKPVSLPEYEPQTSIILHQPAKRLTFPLTSKDIEDIKVLEAKFDSAKNCAALGATQIGISKAITIFANSNDPALKKFRKDLGQTMPKTIWLNPSYEAIGNEMTEDWEGSFSVPETVGLIKRYQKIRYTAFDQTGSKITGIATGFLARIIQHETDLLKGILFIEKAIKTMSTKELDEMRQKMADAK